MKIFVAGATGAVGRRLVPCSSSVARWFGTTTRPGKEDALRAAAARPVVMDV